MADEKTFTQEELDAAIAKATGDVDGLKAKVDELIGDNKKLKADLRKTQDIKPEDIAALESELETVRTKLADATKAANDATKARDKAVKDLEAETGFTQKLVAENGLRDLLLKGGVTDPDFLDMAVGKHLPGIKVVTEGDGRKAMYGDKPLDAFVTELLASDAGKKIVTAPNNSGGDANGGRQVKVAAKTMLRSAYNALDQNAKAELGPQMAKGELKIMDDAA